MDRGLLDATATVGDSTVTDDTDHYDGYWPKGYGTNRRSPLTRFEVERLR